MGSASRADGGNSAVGVTAREEGGREVGALVGGPTVEGYSTALHTISISLQNSLSWNRAERL